MVLWKIADGTAETLQKGSVWLRWRWNRSHYEVVTPLYCLSVVFMMVNFIMDGSRQGAWVSNAILVMMSMWIVSVSAPMEKAKARIHNKPAAVEEWNDLGRFFVLLGLFVGGTTACRCVLTGEWGPDDMGLLCQAGGLIVSNIPGLKVDHEPPSQTFSRPAMDRI